MGKVFVHESLQDRAWRHLGFLFMYLLAIIGVLAGVYNLYLQQYSLAGYYFIVSIVIYFLVKGIKYLFKY